MEKYAMMSRLNLNLKVKVPRERLLTQLKANREDHVKMYHEAVAGFKTQARRRMERILDAVTGTEDIHLSLSAPRNQASAYDTVIEALEWSKEEEMELSMSEFRMLAQDRWDWMDAWLLSNSGYSQTVAAKRASLGDGDDD